MTRTQIFVIVGSVVLALSLYIGCETTPEKFRKLEKSRVLSVEETDIELLKQEAKAKCSAAQVAQLELLEKALGMASSDTARLARLQQLSGAWFDVGSYAVAGHYAQIIAEQAPDGARWGIAGATYAIGLQRAESDNLKAFCAKRALGAFENAVSLDPAEVSHKINLALVYTERPPQENPMKGIQMLLQLQQEYPENAGVYYQLGRLAIQTGQYEKAVERLEKAIALASGRTEAFCLLQQAYEALGDQIKAAQAGARCNRNDQPGVQ
jgi:predicted Zn-dependent protease